MSHPPENTTLWAERLERFTQSAMTVAAFCAAENVSQASYYYWRRKLQGPSRQSKSDQPKPPCPKPARRKRRNPANRTESLAPHAFVPIALASPNEHPQQPTRALTTIELPGGIRVRIDVPAVPTVPFAQSPSGEERS